MNVAFIFWQKCHLHLTHIAHLQHVCFLNLILDSQRCFMCFKHLESWQEKRTRQIENSETVFIRRFVVLLMKPNEFEFSPWESFLWILCCFCQSPNTSLLLTQNVRNGACGSHHYEKVSSEDLEVWGKWGWNFVQRPDADHESDKLWAKGPKRRFLDAIEDDKREGELWQEDDPLWWPL